MMIVINILLAFHVVVSLLIVFVVLMQRPKSEGLGAAFGGGMTENLFGAQTTNVLQKFTRTLGIIFFTLTLLISVLYSREARGSKESAAQKALSEAPRPVAPAAPADSSLPLQLGKPADGAALPLAPGAAEPLNSSTAPASSLNPSTTAAPASTDTKKDGAKP